MNKVWIPLFIFAAFIGVMVIRAVVNERASLETKIASFEANLKELGEANALLKEENSTILGKLAEWENMTYLGGNVDLMGSKSVECEPADNAARVVCGDIGLEKQTSGTKLFRLDDTGGEDLLLVSDETLGDLAVAKLAGGQTLLSVVDRNKLKVSTYLIPIESEGSFPILLERCDWIPGRVVASTAISSCKNIETASFSKYVVMDKSDGSLDFK